MKYSLEQIINSRSEHKKYIDKLDIWVYLIVRPLSNILTWIFLRLHLTANLATLVATLIGFIGTVLLMIPGHTLLGLILINLWIVFDCIDGNIARTTKTSSKIGEFLDGVSGYIFLSLLYMGIGVSVFHDYGLIIGSRNQAWIYILMGAVTSMACILPRLIDNKAKTMFTNYKSDVSNKDGYSPIFILALNISGVAGLANPLMIIAYATGTLNLYLVAYFCIQSAIGGAAVYKTLKSIIQLDKEVS